MSGNSYPFNVKVTKIYHLNVTAKTEAEAVESVAAMNTRQVAQRGEAVSAFIETITLTDL